MAKEEIPYKVSADQLIADGKNRDIVGCSIGLDIALGGGIPLGATVLIGGKQKLGKTTLCLQFGANAQQKFKSKIKFFNIEGRLTQLVLQQVHNIRTDQDSFEVIMPPAIFDKENKVVGHKKWPAERWFEEIGQCIIDNPGSVVIVDSISSLCSEKENSESIGYQDRGGANKLQSQFCRKYGDLVVPSKVMLLMIAHIQANTSGYGAPIQMKVGNDIRHQADTILFGKSIEKWQPINGKILGQEMNYTIECSALGPPFVEVAVPLRYGSGVDYIKDLINQCVNWGIIKDSASWFVLPFLKSEDKAVPFDNIEDFDVTKAMKLQGSEKVYQWLLMNKNASNILDAHIRKKVFG